MRWRTLLAVASLALVGQGGGAGCGSGPREEKAAGLPPDRECLSFLQTNGVPAAPAGSLPGVRTPVRITGAAGGVSLVPRGRREPVMDCALARALFEAAPLFRSLGLEALEFSSAYDYRTRRHAEQLSAHAHGLAVDVHVFRGPRQRLEIERDFEKGVGQWRKLRAGPGALARCIGQPKTDAGATLRKLVCRLKLHTAFQIVVTPDDDADHRDHLHLEVHPDAEPLPEPEPAGATTPPEPSPAKGSRAPGSRPRRE